jgi:hypothetical protein
LKAGEGCGPAVREFIQAGRTGTQAQIAAELGAGVDAVGVHLRALEADHIACRVDRVQVPGANGGLVLAHLWGAYQPQESDGLPIVASALARRTPLELAWTSL